MRHAREDYERFQDPAGLIPDDEPVMLFRGQDRFAADVLEYYANRLVQVEADREMVRRVRDHADKMRAWPTHKTPDLLPNTP